jgi:RND family efflux transporter MFP subunit
MKSTFPFLFIATLLITACGAKQEAKTGDKAAQLEQLKTQAADLAKQIEALEAELGADSKKDNVKITPVTVETLQPTDFQHFVNVQGRLEAKDMVMVSAKMGGQITQITVKEGDFVSAGQTLAILDKETMEKSIDEISKGLEIANTLYDKQKALWDQKIGTEVQYLSAKNNKESLEKRLATLRSQMKQLIVTAPFSGVIDEIYAKNGSLAAPGVPLMKLVNFSNMKAKANVPDIYITRVQKGDKVVINFPDINEKVNGTITFVAQVVDPLTRSFTIEASFSNPGNRYKPNMLAVIEINDETKKDAIVVYENLIQNSENGKLVFVAIGTGTTKTASARYVETGLTYNGKVEIVKGLQAGDLLITQGYQDLVDGQHISF